MDRSITASIKAFFSLLWRVLTSVRQGLANTLFIISLLLIVVIYSNRSPDPLQEESALLFNPVGVVVDQKRYQNPFQALMNNPVASEREVLLRDLIEAIELAKDDPAINSLVLDLNRLYFVGVSKTSEISAALDDFRASGKPIIAIADYYSQDQYLLASYADEIMLHPMGAVLLEGYSNYQNYFAEALAKLRINVHVFKVGNYKSAVEPFVRNDMSDYAAEASYRWLNQLWTSFIDNIVVRRGVAPEALSQYIDNYDVVLEQVGGNAAEAALALGLIDSIKNRSQMNDALIAKIGGSDEAGLYRSVSYDKYLLLRDIYDAKPAAEDKVAVIVAKGMILDGEQPPGMIGGDTLATLILRAQQDDDIDALVLRIDSGGGSAFASEIVREQVLRFKESEKPLVVSMGSVAASGGYWISANASEIWATPATLTGSIGVFGMFPTLEDSLAGLGVRTDGVGTTRLAGSARLDRAINPVFESALQHTLNSTYQRFLEIVAQGRKMDLADVDDAAQGRVWTGTDAKDRGLVDKLGGLNGAISAAAELAGVTEYEVHYITDRLGPRELLLKRLSGAMGLLFAQHESPDKLLRGLNSLFAPITSMVRYLTSLNDPQGVYAHCALCVVP